MLCKGCKWSKYVHATSFSVTLVALDTSTLYNKNVLQKQLDGNIHLFPVVPHWEYSTIAFLLANMLSVTLDELFYSCLWLKTSLITLWVFFNVLSICVCLCVCVSLAFVTLLNGDQAQDAIRNLHQTSIRGRDITVQLQPTDSLLCVTNLPYTLTSAQFQELVRTYGNIERCFLVYSDLTGHSKGYGFVEYMKKDSASRARSELLGKPLGDRALMVQWADVNQLTSTDHLHSKCLCVDRLPLDFEDSEELAHIFSERYKPVFCQVRLWNGCFVLVFGISHSWIRAGEVFVYRNLEGQ